MNRPQPWENKLFELFCRNFALWKYPSYSHLVLYGVNGERQYGCDVMDQDRRLIIQCKCYDNTNPNAHRTLVNVAINNYNSACNHFPQMERFVVCTTLDKRRETQDALYAARKGVPIDVWFWEDLKDYTDGELSTNRNYSKDYESPLFLHSNNSKVCLKNLYVPNSFQVYEIKDNDLFNDIDISITTTSPTMSSIRMHEQKNEDVHISEIASYNEVHRAKIRGDIWEQLSYFIKKNDDQLLIIEGDAGCGKTSLVQALCWHEQEGDDIAKKVLNGHPLLTVRLRDIDKKTIAQEKNLLAPILDYLQIPQGISSERKGLLLRRFPEAVLVLDGFDELCIIDGITECEKLLFKLVRERLTGWSFIVTSRPHYIRKELGFSYTIIALEHFNKDKRAAWVNNYICASQGSQAMNPEIAEYIINGSEEGVCDTPLSLYLLASGNIKKGDISNLWKLYRRLFHSEIAIRQYDKDDHPGSEYLKYVYRLPGEVAHAIYRNGNVREYISGEELSGLIENIYQSSNAAQVFLKNNHSQIEYIDYAQRCVALCCYWKVNEARGAIEFYHNNIRDFFLCEKIFDDLNAHYKSEKAPAEKATAIAYWFRNNFRSGELPEKVCQFLWLRSLYGKNYNKIEFPMIEREERLLPLLFERILSDGTFFDGMDEHHLFPAIASIIRCIGQVYRAVLEPFRENSELIVWWYDVDEINRSGIFNLCAKSFFGCGLGNPSWRNPGSYGSFKSLALSAIFLPETDLTGSDFSKSDLRNAILHGAYMPTINLSGADLSGANLEGAVLRGSILKETVLRNANLRRTNLQRATLEHAILRSSDLSFSDLQFANARGADMSQSDLSYSDCWNALLRSVDFSSANLNGTDFRCADLRGAELRGTDLCGFPFANNPKY